MGWDTLAAIAAVLAAAWSYGSAGEERRLEFKAWFLGNIKRAKPTALFLFSKLTLLVCAIGAGSIVWSSAWDIYEFKVSLEPLTRGAIINLLVAVFNAFCYAVAFFAVLIGLFRRKPDASEEYWHVTGNELRLMFEKENFSQEGIESLLQTGITLRVVNVRRGEVQIRAEGPNGVSIV